MYLIIHSSEKTTGEGYIPFGFCHMVRMSLSRMASTGELNPELVNMSFWKLWPTKFKSVSDYEKRKMVIVSFFF